MPPSQAGRGAPTSAQHPSKALPCPGRLPTCRIPDLPQTALEHRRICTGSHPSPHHPCLPSPSLGLARKHPPSTQGPAQGPVMVLPTQACLPPSPGDRGGWDTHTPPCPPPPPGRGKGCCIRACTHPALQGGGVRWLPPPNAFPLPSLGPRHPDGQRRRAGGGCGCPSPATTGQDRQPRLGPLI